jgi:parallel beta-helix repeat protein
MYTITDTARFFWARRSVPRLVGAGCLVAGSAAVAAAFPAGAAVVQATTARAVTYAQNIAVTSLGNAGAGTLRAAIDSANAAPPGNSTLISFTVNGTIGLSAPLPAIARNVTIDATTAPGHADGGPPAVAVDFNGHSGLLFASGSGGSQLLGVAVDGAGGNGVTLEAGQVTLNGDYIGLSPAGEAVPNGGNGVYAAAGSAGNLIGLNAARAPGVVANVISGNRGSGIVLAGSSGNTLVDNRIGTSASGTAAIANRGDGIRVTAGARDNEIGGTAFTDTATGQANDPTGNKGMVTPAFVVPPLGNLVSGNGGDGVLIDGGSRGNVLNGNFIGTTASGDGALGNDGDGVWIDRAPGNSLIGCDVHQDPFVYYNVIDGNHGNGLRVTSSDDVTVHANFLGVGADNTTLIGNGRDGVLVDGTSRNTQVGGIIPLGNVSAGNGRNGIEVAGTASGFTTFNSFGGVLAFKGAAPNGRDGLLITSTGGGNLVRTNVFSGNKGNGIELAGGASGVTIDPDFAGTNTTGKFAVPNGGDGLLIDGTAHDNTIGGTLPSIMPQNTFSGNHGYGVAITGRAHGNRIFGTFIGTKAGGTAAVANQRGGVLVTDHAYGNVIGAHAPAPSDLVSGNDGNGVTLTSGTAGNSVLNNYIGLGKDGQPLPNGGLPVVNAGHGNLVLGNRTATAGVPVTG